ncbi:MAG: RagB/SusD family nutrient uptake outer membrane protein [Rikenellaceae bacterium]
MKTIRKITIAALSLFAVSGLSSCEDYLDMSPSMGVDVSVVFSDYTSVSLYLAGAYKWVHDELDYGSLGNQYSWSPGIADECAGVYNSYGLGTIHSGNWGATNVSGFEIGDNGTVSLGSDSGTVIFRAYRTLRICNSTIANADLVTMTDDERNKLLGQAHFLRAWAYFQLIRRYGGMPDLTTLYDEISDYDQPRLTYHGSNDLLIADLDMAISMLPDQWDEPNIGRANKSSAYGLKSLAMTYDASPLMQNDLNSTVNNGYSTERALLAAQATQAAINYVNSGAGPNRLSCVAGSVLGDGTDFYPRIFSWSTEDISNPTYYYQPEEGMWYNRDNSPTQSTSVNIYLLPQKWANGSLSGGGNWVYSYFAPTQNMVDLYEKLGSDGNYHPITSTDLAGYEPSGTGAVSNMYVDRDPRFYHNIIAPGMQRSCCSAQEMQPIINDYYKYNKDNNDGILYQGVMYDQATNEYIINREQTGYALNKFCWKAIGANGDEDNGFVPDRESKRIPTVFIRVSSLYLNYAEMAYEATGSYNTKPSGCSMTAEQALNVIRNRAGLTNWYSKDPNDSFRDAYRRERAVELMFENHRWHDIRRWMIAESLFASQYPIYGVYAMRQNYSSSDAATAGSEDNGYTGNLLGFAGDECDVIKSDGAIICTPVPITCENRVFTNRNYWYPFSTYDVDALDNLQQNPGW